MGYNVKFSDGREFTLDKEPTQEDIEFLDKETKSKTNRWEDVKIGLGGLASTGVKNASLAATTLVTPFTDQEYRDQILENMDAGVDRINHWANPNQSQQGLGGKIISTAVGMGPLLAAGPAGLLATPALASSEATENIKAGADAGESLAAAGVNQGLMLAGGVAAKPVGALASKLLGNIPRVGGVLAAASPVVTSGLGFAGGAELGRIGAQSILEDTPAKANYKFDPEQMVANFVTGSGIHMLTAPRNKSLPNNSSDQPAKALNSYYKSLELVLEGKSKELISAREALKTSEDQGTSYSERAPLYQSVHILESEINKIKETQTTIEEKLQKTAHPIVRDQDGKIEFSSDDRLTPEQKLTNELEAQKAEKQAAESLERLDSDLEASANKHLQEVKKNNQSSSDIPFWEKIRSTPVTGFVATLKKLLDQQDQAKFIEDNSRKPEAVQKFGELTKQEGVPGLAGLELTGRLDAANNRVKYFEHVYEKFEEILRRNYFTEDDIAALHETVVSLREHGASLGEIVKATRDFKPSREKFLLDQYNKGEITGGELVSKYLKPQIDSFFGKENHQKGTYILGESLTSNSKLVNGINSILKVLGLDKTDILIVDESVFPIETFGNKGGLHQYNSQRDFHIIVLDSRAQNKHFFGELFGDQAKSISMLLTAAHEIGHAYLYRLIDHNLLTVEQARQVAVSFRDMVKGDPKELLKKFGSRPIKNEDIILQKLISDPIKFGEFFADSILRYVSMSENAFVSKTAPGPIRKAAITLRDMFKSLTDYVNKTFGDKVGIPAEFIDSLVRDFVKANEDSVTKFGLTIFELETNKMSSVNNGRDFRILMDKINNYDPLNEFKSSGNYKDDAINFQKETRKKKLTIQEAIKAQLSMPSDAAPIGSKILSYMVGNLQLSQFYKEHPIVTKVFDVVREAEYYANKVKFRLWQGSIDSDLKRNLGPLRSFERKDSETSPHVLMKQASDVDINMVLKAFEWGFYNSSDYSNTLKVFGTRLTTFQKKLFSSLSDMFYEQYELLRFHNSEVKFRTGWFPAVRRGDFVVTLEMSGTPVHLETFRSELEANKFIDHFNSLDKNSKLGLTPSSIINVKELNSKTAGTFTFGLDLARDIADGLGESDKAEVNSLINKLVQAIDPASKHREARSGMTGYMGSRLFSSEIENARDFREAIKHSLNETIQRIRKSEINKKTSEIFNESNALKDRFPNAYSIAEMIKDSATNGTPAWTESFDTHLRNTVDSLFVKIAERFGNDHWHPSVPMVDRVTGVLGRLFYIRTLTSRAAFIAGQALTPVISIREMLHNANSWDALVSAAKGTLNILTGGNEEFGKFINHLTDNSETIKPNFINDFNALGNSETVSGKAFKWITLETPASIADSFSRYWTASMFYEHFKSEGLSGKELFSAVREATDRNMGLYNRGYKAPIYNRLGIVGQTASTLQTFATNQLGNLLTDIKTAKNKGNYAPVVATFLISMLMGGVIGAPLVAEYEAIRKLLISLDDDLESILPSIMEWGLKGDNKIVSHGVLSTTGYDIGSGMRWNPILSGIIAGHNSFLDYFPSVAYGTKLFSDLSTIAEDRLGTRPQTKAKVRSAMMGVAPTAYLAGAIDQHDFNTAERKFVPDKNRGYGIVPQTPEETISTYLGTRTIKRANEEQGFYIEKEKDKIRGQKRQKAIDLLVDSFKEQNQNKRKEAIRSLTKLGVDPDQIVDEAFAAQVQRNRSLLHRFAFGSSLDVTGKDQLRKWANIKDYKVD